MVHGSPFFIILGIVFSNISTPIEGYDSAGFPTEPTAYYATVDAAGRPHVFGTLGHDNNHTHWMLAHSGTRGRGWDSALLSVPWRSSLHNLLLPAPGACAGCLRNLANTQIGVGHWATEWGWEYTGGHTVFRPLPGAERLSAETRDAGSSVRFSGVPAPGLNTTACRGEYYPYVFSSSYQDYHMFF